MLRLLLFRHAKSSWEEPGVADEERPLVRRGKRAAEEMGRLIADRGLVPQLVLCSPAKRARETLERAVPFWQPEPQLRTVAGLYDAIGNDYLDLVRGNGVEPERLMLVGHNPAIQRTALALAGTGAVGLQRSLAAKFPTAAVAVIDFAVHDWRAAAAGAGMLIEFLMPG